MKATTKNDVRTTLASRESSQKLPRCFLDLDKLSQPIDFNGIFGGDGDLEVEIGVGKGRFIRERAMDFPDRNFLGIEKSLKYLHQAGERIDSLDIKNVRLVCCYAEELLSKYFTSESVSKFHILFSDPWPKKRHHKRRLFQPAFLEESIRCLKDDGQIHVATDHQKYFEVIQELFDTFKGSLEIEKLAEPGPFMSNFEAKYLKEGRPIYYLTATKKPTSPKV